MSDTSEYRAFRTGLTFAEVRRMLWSPSTDPRDWRYKRRGSVLGLWRQIKQEMWRERERREGELGIDRNESNNERSNELCESL